MKIQCIRCGNIFQNMSLFQNHLVKKSDCIVEHIYLPIELYRIHFRQLNEIFNDKVEEIKNSKDNTIYYGCEYCGKTFSDRKYSYKHKKQYCSQRELNQKLYESTAKKTVSDKTVNNNKRKYIKNKKAKKNIDPVEKNEIEHIQTNEVNNINELFNNKNNQQNNNYQNINTQNNIHTQNNNNINSNNVINNIIIKNYNDNDKDDDVVDGLSENMKRKILKSPKTAIEMLYHLIHMETPEYMNIYINSHKEGCGYVYNNGEWEPKKMNDLLEDILITNADRLYDISKTTEVKKIYMKKITDQLNKISENGPDAIDIKSKIKYRTLKYKNTIKNNFEESTKRKLRLKPITNQSI